MCSLTWRLSECYRYRLSWRVGDAGIFYLSAAIPLRINSFTLDATGPFDFSIASMISASVRRLSLAAINTVFSFIQFFLASLSAIVDFILLLCYTFYKVLEESVLFHDPTRLFPWLDGKTVNQDQVKLPLLAGFGGRLFLYLDSQRNSRKYKHDQRDCVGCAHRLHLLSVVVAVALCLHNNIGIPIVSSPKLTFFVDFFLALKTC